MNLAMLLTFRFIGFGVNRDSILLNPSIQSRKLSAVWTGVDWGQILPVERAHDSSFLLGRSWPVRFASSIPTQFTM